MASTVPVSSPTSASTSAAATMPEASGSSSSNSAPLTPTKEIPVFEFTKRKRWADLLVTELNDTIIFVLSEACTVWYCGNAVTELLGWRDEELVDSDLIDLMNAGDRVNFRTAFAESVRARTEMLAYARLQCKNEFFVSANLTPEPREVLFEIRGRPHYLPDSGDFKCYFAMAQPYPSRNTAMLNTFLELKMENERLQQRVAQLRLQSQALDGAADSFFSTSENFGVPAVDGGRTNFEPGVGPSLVTDADEDGPRKKLKRAAAEQHVCVTCGRTDSPEWRKGPNGPKTLCNACGLRWAKKARKNVEGEGEGDGAQNSGSTLVF
ncbi:transcription factor [Ganoderma sinense ZZ0214-1]|uniref:Transcription factor n=1 Tax=Ganoderma sinense ZZ0214-1 TaxID=1077348 RepID=A0A2G8RRZ4_9APHY|nr:transcription factor [Ganoderma sinense ZZ0214-1]